MQIYGREYSRREIQRLIGGMHQIGGTRRYEFTDGGAKGVAAIEFDTGDGLRFTALPDRGFDICQASYRGINLVFQTPNGIVHPAYYNPRGRDWLRTFCAGLLTTCGLTYLGAPGSDNGEELGLHGRYSAIPAMHVNDLSGWRGDEYHLEAAGVVEEGALFGDKIRLARTVSTRIGARCLRIHDVAENFGYRASPFTVLYHINLGFPLLEEGSELLLSARDTEPYDDVSRKGIDCYGRFGGPVSGYTEQNFLHEMAADREGYAWAALVNRRLGNGLGVYLSFKKASLPFLSQWKMLSEGEYVTGLEPCNVKCENRGKLRASGRLPFLTPGAVQEMDLEIGVLDGPIEIEALARRISEIKDTR